MRLRSQCWPAVSSDPALPWLHCLVSCPHLPLDCPHAESAEVWEEAGLCSVRQEGWAWLPQCFSFLLTQSFSGSRGPLTAHLHPEERPRGQSRGSRKLSETEGEGGILIDNTCNSSGDGVGALCCVNVYNLVRLVAAIPSCCSVAKSCLASGDLMDCSTPAFPVLHYLLEFSHVHVH